MTFRFCRFLMTSSSRLPLHRESRELMLVSAQLARVHSLHYSIILSQSFSAHTFRFNVKLPMNYKSNLSMLKNFADASTFCFAFQSFYRSSNFIVYVFVSLFFSLARLLANSVSRKQSAEEKFSGKLFSYDFPEVVNFSKLCHKPLNYLHLALPASRTNYSDICFHFKIISACRLRQNRWKFNENVDSLRSF